MTEERTVQTALDVKHIEALPKVASYYDNVYQKAYSARWSGYLSGMVMGSLSGAVVGLLAAFVPALVMTAPPTLTLALIGQSAALFASLGSVIGAGICTQVGVTAGAVAAGFEEHERRDKLEKIRAQNPELAAEIEKAATAKADALHPQGSWQRFMQAIKRSVDWRQLTMGLVAGAIFGVTLAINPITSMELTKMGSLFAGVSEAARISVLTLVGSLVGGAYFGVMGGVSSNVMSNAAAPLISGKIFEAKEKGKEVAVEYEPLQDQCDKSLKSFKLALENSRLLEKENQSLPISLV